VSALGFASRRLRGDKVYDTGHFPRVNTLVGKIRETFRACLGIWGIDRSRKWVKYDEQE
jgi:hypothetical protein